MLIVENLDKIENYQAEKNVSHDSTTQRYIVDILSIFLVLLFIICIHVFIYTYLNTNIIVQLAPEQ